MRVLGIMAIALVKHVEILKTERYHSVVEITFFFFYTYDISRFLKPPSDNILRNRMHFADFKDLLYQYLQIFAILYNVIATRHHVNKSATVSTLLVI
jgi:hypothetical protein